MSKSPDTRASEDLTYDTYLKVSELISLQQPRSEPAHHDEMLFIIIHQAYELWFKLILHELEQAIHYMNEGSVLRARHFVHRSVKIMQLLVDQIHILETMTPAEFLEFRDRLGPSSGFQSTQFRELEFLAGVKNPAYLRFFKNHPDQIEKLEKRLREPDLRSTYYDMLRRTGFEIPESEDMQGETFRQGAIDALKPVYQDPEKYLPLYLLTESLVEFDEFLILWRTHHVHVVARVIGFKTGTGGSSGVAYLKSTCDKKCFPLLWEVRSYLS